MSSLAERLRQERAAWGLSQAELARRAGAKRQSNISNLETGGRQGSTLLPRIAAALNLNPLWLQDGVGQKYADPALAVKMGFLEPTDGTMPPPGGTPTAASAARLYQLHANPSNSIPVINQTEVEMLRELINNPNRANKTLQLDESRTGELFAFLLDDDSMAGVNTNATPRGWYAVLDAARTPNVGDVVLVRLEDGRAYLREYVADAGGRMLRPFNPQFSSRPAPEDSGAYLGVMVGRMFSEMFY